MIPIQVQQPIRTNVVAGVLGVLATAILMADTAAAADWPMWRCDAARSAVTEEALPEKLHEQWTLRLPALKPAFRNSRLQFDLGYEPVVVGKTLLVGSSFDDSVAAFSTETGTERWRSFSGGPVRFAPVAWEGKVYFGSDDGHLYCLNLATGKLVWRFRAVPSNRKLLGSGRLISVWPVRGGPVLADDVIYFAAGVWSFEGVFVYALDAKTGKTIWLNDRAGYIYGQHPHAAQAFGGLTPQGYLVVNGNELIVPCGSALPAKFDRKTGKLTHFELPKRGRFPGGWFTAAAKAKRRGQTSPDVSEILFDAAVNKDRHENGWHTGPGGSDVLGIITAGDRKLSFADKIDCVTAPIHSLLVADGKLFVVSRAGTIHCFGPQPRRQPDGVTERPNAKPSQQTNPQRLEAKSRVKRIIDAARVNQGYALVTDIDDGLLAEELVRQTDLNVIGIGVDSKQVDDLRRRVSAQRMGTQRLSFLADDPLDLGLPPYFASLIVANEMKIEAIAVQKLFRLLRPFGGTACFLVSADQHTQIAVAVEQAKLANAKVHRVGAFTLLQRIGALPGSTNYTGGWSSPDQLVKAPLGVLWYDDSVANFKRAPQPMFVDGVMVTHDKSWRGWVDGDRPPFGLKKAVFMDVYTGRVLSQSEASVTKAAAAVLDIQQKQPTQYRPPTQTNAWSPKSPVVGTRVNPLTGKTEPRAIIKSYGCDGGNDYGLLFTVRSGTAAFYDKRIESGTVHISGPRSGCTNSIIPANGVLNVPYYYQGCTCSYPLPVGLAMVNMPQEFEQWTVWGKGQSGPIQRVGINLGAPGDRVTNAGTLWLEHPSVAGESPDVKVSVEPQSAKTFYRHSIWIGGGQGWPWVAASGVEGLDSLTIDGLKPAKYTVRLYFTEPHQKQPGERVFDVATQGKPVLQNFDIVKLSGGRLRSLVREFSKVDVDGQLKLAFVRRVGSPLLCGIEVVADSLKLGPVVTLSERDTDRQTQE